MVELRNVVLYAKIVGPHAKELTLKCNLRLIFDAVPTRCEGRTQPGKGMQSCDIFLV